MQYNVRDLNLAYHYLLVKACDLLGLLAQRLLRVVGLDGEQAVLLLHLSKFLLQVAVPHLLRVQVLQRCVHISVHVVQLLAQVVDLGRLMGEDKVGLLQGGLQGQGLGLLGLRGHGSLEAVIVLRLRGSRGYAQDWRVVGYITLYTEIFLLIFMLIA